jgi:hypothetical protein
VNGFVTCDKSAPGVLAVPCASLHITGADARVETRQDEQIVDNCHVNIAGGRLDIGNIIGSGHTETIGALTLAGDGGPAGVGLADGSVLVLNGNLSVLAGTVPAPHKVLR